MTQPTYPVMDLDDDIPQGGSAPTGEPTSAMCCNQGSPVLGHIREMCLALPDTTERLSHGAPSFFVRGKRCFLMFHDNHHGDGRLALWCAAPPAVQTGLVETSPEYFFVPPYVGHMGWLGIRLDRDLDWEIIAAPIEAGYWTRAGKIPGAGRLRQ